MVNNFNFFVIIQNTSFYILVFYKDGESPSKRKKFKKCYFPTVVSCCMCKKCHFQLKLSHVKGGKSSPNLNVFIVHTGTSTYYLKLPSN